MLDMVSGATLHSRQASAGDGIFCYNCYVNLQLVSYLVQQRCCTAVAVVLYPCMHVNMCLLTVVLFQPDDTVNVAIEKINALLESFLGISDTELGKISVWMHLMLYKTLCKIQCTVQYSRKH